MSVFNELKASLHEAVDIKQGAKSPSRLNRFEVADVKALRSQLNVSKQELAAAMGTPVSTPSKAGKTNDATQLV